MSRLRKAKLRSVQRMPMDERRVRVKGDSTRPPTPEPESTNPMAVARFVVKYSGVVLRIGK
jgi:hypothetical protein